MRYNSRVTTPMKKSTLISLICFFLVMSLVLISTGAFIRTLVSEMESDITVDSSKYDKTVTATIVENESSTVSVGKGMDSRETETYLPIYQYEYKGNSYTARGSVASTNAHYAVGDKTIVNISSDNPSEMYDPAYNAETEYGEFKLMTKTMWIAPIILGIIPIILIFVIIAVYIRRSSYNQGY